jgi:predicted nucleic acid-binding Zn ribbon protein
MYVKTFRDDTLTSCDNVVKTFRDDTLTSCDNVCQDIQR